MKFKPIRFIPEYAGIHFMKAARYGFVGSAILIFFTIIIYFAIGINLGIDFRGGTLIEIRTAAPADLRYFARSSARSSSAAASSCRNSAHRPTC